MTEVQPLPRMTEAPVALPRHELADEAEQLLGYTFLGNWGRKERDAAQLYELCVSLGIRPFQTEAVVAYKEKKKHAANYTTATRTVARGRNIFGQVTTAQETVTVRADQYNTWHWERREMKQHYDAVPLPVLEMAVKLKKANPEVGLFVDVLQVRSNVDPFLVVCLGWAELYIAVWDEPGFDAKYD